MKTRYLNNAVLDWLRSDTASSPGKVGDADVPSTEPPMPYCVVTMQVAGPGKGSLADPEEDREFVFFILNVGRSREQAQWMSDIVKDRMLSLPEAVVHNGITVGNVQGVSVDSIGVIVRVGDVLFQGQDSYRVKAGT